MQWLIEKSANLKSEAESLLKAARDPEDASVQLSAEKLERFGSFLSLLLLVLEAVGSFLSQKSSEPTPPHQNRLTIDG